MQPATLYAKAQQKYYITTDVLFARLRCSNNARSRRPILLPIISIDTREKMPIMLPGGGDVLYWGMYDEKHYIVTLQMPQCALNNTRYLQCNQTILILFKMVRTYFV